MRLVTVTVTVTAAVTTPNPKIQRVNFMIWNRYHPFNEIGTGGSTDPSSTMNVSNNNKPQTTNHQNNRNDSIRPPRGVVATTTTSSSATTTYDSLTRLRAHTYFLVFLHRRRLRRLRRLTSSLPSVSSASSLDNEEQLIVFGQCVFWIPLILREKKMGRDDQ